MVLVILYALITVLSVFFGLKKQKPILFTMPILALFGYFVIKIATVPLPFWETVQFIFGLK